MARASETIGVGLLFGILAGVVSAEAGPDKSRAAGEAPARAERDRPVQWKLWVGKRAYGVSPRGGQAPLPKGSEWQCRYSALLERNKRNLKEETVTVTCALASAEFSLSASCSYPVDPHKHVDEGVMPSELQSAVLGGRTFVGLSCDVPGYELRTYRKK